MILENAFISIHEKAVKGTLIYENGTVYIKEKDIDPEITITSPFINAHTHLGDGFIESVPRLDVKSLVGPGGFKAKMLQITDREKIRDSIKYSIKIMNGEYISSFFDFRESGMEGLKLLENLDFGNITPFILSRPAGKELDKTELNELLKLSSGFGMSGINDYPLHFLEEVSLYAKNNNKLFAIHASEAERENIDEILRLNPDFVIHMYNGSIEDFEKLIARDIPIIICPSSAIFFNHKFDTGKFKLDGIKIGIGTDNAMITVPSIRSEMRIAWLYFSMEAEKIIEYSTITMQRFTGKPSNILIFNKKPQKVVRDPFYRPDRFLKINEINFE